MEKKTSIIIETETRNKLRKIGRKDQTYDQLIKDLIKLKNKMDLPDQQLQNYNLVNP
jgi:hypothetical protein